MNDLTRTERLLNLLYLIQNNPGIKAKELASIFCKTIRTIQRDICDLRSIGFIIDSSTGADGGFASRGSYNLKPLVFSGAEALAVFTASQVLLEQNGFPYTNNLKTALEKISQAINENEEKVFEILEPRTSIIVKNMKDYYPWGDIFSRINKAIIEQNIITITYDSYSSRTVSERRVNPYHMLFRDGCWYLIGFCHVREEIRIFRVDRIKAIETLNKKFLAPEDFSIVNYFQNSWEMGKGEKITVKVRFDAPISRLIRENTWHQGQIIEEIEGDSIIYTVSVEGTFEIKKWILGWGAGAVCLEPESLKAEIMKEIRESLGRYENKQVYDMALRGKYGH